MYILTTQSGRRKGFLLLNNKHPENYKAIDIFQKQHKRLEIDIDF